MRESRQAAQLICVLAEEEPAELKSAWKAALKHGGKLKNYIEKSGKLLPQNMQDILASL